MQIAWFQGLIFHNFIRKSSPSTIVRPLLSLVYSGFAFLFWISPSKFVASPKIAYIVRFFTFSYQTWSRCKSTVLPFSSVSPSSLSPLVVHDYPYYLSPLVLMSLVLALLLLLPSLSLSLVLPPLLLLSV